MSQEIYVVAFEGGERYNVLDYAAAQASKAEAKLHILHVLEWSPYSFLTMEELAERHGRRKQEMERAENAVLQPALKRAEAAGAVAEGELRYGQVVEIIAETAERLGAALIFVGRTGSNAIGARIFGSVPLGVAQIAPVPTVIVP